MTHATTTILVIGSTGKTAIVAPALAGVHKVYLAVRPRDRG